MDVSHQEASLITAIDHIPIAVRDLEAAGDRFRRLGFTLKEGRFHENGIRNLHAKFPDGTELELITAPEARDALTSAYREFLEGGDGPAFLGFTVHDVDEAAEYLGPFASRAQTGRYISFPYEDPLNTYFLVERLQSPTDRPEHFQHANGAISLVRVWIASSNADEIEALFGQFGIAFTDGRRCLPQCQDGRIAMIGRQELVMLGPGDRPVNDRTIRGATVLVESLDAVQAALAAGDPLYGVTTPSPDATSLFIPPEHANGLWIEFRSADAVTSS